jgi:hypothetical protein
VDVEFQPFDPSFNYAWNSQDANFYGSFYNYYYGYTDYAYNEFYAAGDYILSIMDPLGCTLEVPLTISGPPGDQQAFGDGVWLVNAYAAGSGNGWNPNEYSGYYIDSSLNYDSESKWDQHSSPSAAPGYQGCNVNYYYMSWSAKRRGFDCGIYQIDVLKHDDEAELFVDGVKVWEHYGCCDNHDSVWIGALNANSRVEFRVAQGGGEANGAINLTMVSGIDSFITVTGNEVMCTGQAYSLNSIEGASYLWSNGATVNPLAASESGTYSVTVTDDDGCVLTSAPVSITILPDAAPVANITPSAPAFCDWNTSPITLTSDSAIGSTWSTGDSTVSISVSEVGVYNLTVTNSAGLH